MKAQLQSTVATVALLATMAGASGCAAFASANAAHSHITPCVDEMGFSIVDLVLAGASTGILAATGALDESPEWMLLPGTFLASGVIGSIFVHKCRGDLHRKQASMPMPVYPVIIDETPTTTLPDATPEELGLPAAPAVPPDPRLQLRPDSALKEAPKKPEEERGEGSADAPATRRPPDDPEQQKIMCGVDVPTPCPQGQRCVIVAERRGYCAPHPELKRAPQ